MYRFPSNSKRKKLWERKVRRLYWEATKNSRLCEAHFEQDQFEKGHKKLKKDAIPTLFSRQIISKHRSPLKRRSNDEQEIENTPRKFQNDHTYFLPVSGQPTSPYDKIEEACTNLNGIDQQNANEATENDLPSEKKYNKLKTMLKSNRSELNKVKKEKENILTKKIQQEERVAKIFNEDQLKALSRKKTNGLPWGDDTIKNALQLRFACGPTGYNLLIDKHFPLPSIRTLQRRMEKIPFEPGILHTIFDILKVKVEQMKPQERLCCLTMDEMTITPSVEYDRSNGNILGETTLPGNSGVATHGLVFMLRGLTTRWKQTVAYHYTGNSVNGEAFVPIIDKVIELSSKIGLIVIAVTSDMGSANRAAWRKYGIVCSKYAQTINKIEHPHATEQHKWLYFIADVPHVLKNIKATIVNGHKFALPDDVVKANKLPSNTASKGPIQALLDFQLNRELKLAPNLRPSLLKPSHFEKMKVSHALNLISHAVSAGIKYLIECENYDKGNLTTAWLIEQINHWFDLMSSRNPVMALSKMNEAKYNEAISFLKSFVDLFQRTKIGNESWKPIQTGIILSTKSILDLQEELLNDKGVHFLLTSRFTQDCLENLFSSVRLKNPVPSPLEFKYALKIITTAQYLKTVSTGNYQLDDGEFLADLLNCPAIGLPQADDDCGNIRLSSDADNLDKADLNSLYYLAGYCMSKIQKYEAHCEVCISSGITSPSTPNEYASTLTKHKDYNGDSLVYVSEPVFDIIKETEKTFRQIKEHTFLNAKNVKAQIMERAKVQTDHIQLPDCHAIKHKILSRFINVRIQIMCKNLREKQKTALNDAKLNSEFGSKSVAMRKLVEKIK